MASADRQILARFRCASAGALFVVLFLADPAAAAVPKLAWRACGDGVQCATAAVPLDHDQPRGAKIRLAVVRRPARGPAQRIGSVFFNPGGPGDSGVEQVRGLAGGGRLNERFDFVGFDPRGVGASRPAVRCASDREKDALFRGLPRLRPGTLARYLALGDRIAAGCRRRTPSSILRHLSTADAARDLDLLRRAVGDPKLTYIGYSYGTELGAVYATLFPKSVRAMALDGGVDHLRFTRDALGWSLGRASTSEAALGRFFGFCEASPGDCPYADHDPRGAFDGLMTRLRAAPIAGTASDPRSLDDTLARVAAFAAMYDRTAWPGLGAGLAAARDGDSGVLRLMADRVVHRGSGGSYDNYLDANTVITANDSRPPTRAAYARHLRSLLGRSPHFADFTMLLDAARRTLSPGDDAYRGRLRYPSGPPALLVVASTGDNATPYASGAALARQLGNARLLTREGDGHTAFRFSSCIREHMYAYVLDGVLPPPGTRWASD